MSTDTTTPEVKPDLGEVTDSLTGYDEIAISKAFGRDFADLLNSPILLARAAIFTLRRREGDKDPVAFKAAMSMVLGDVNDYFAEDAEINPDEPETPAGEDGSQPV